MNENIVAGLVSGILVTFLVVVIRSIWRDTIVPWFENRVYKDVLIEGTWFSVYPTLVGERQETVSLKRHGHEVTGTIICNTGLDEGEQYTVHGSFRNLILSLIYESADRATVDRGTITLKCIRSGRRLSGKIASYDHATDSIRSAQVVWFRSKAEQEELLTKVRLKVNAIRQLREAAEEVDASISEISKSSEVDPDNSRGREPERETVSNGVP